jgi:hypothetical protein
VAQAKILLRTFNIVGLRWYLSSARRSASTSTLEPFQKFRHVVSPLFAVSGFVPLVL